MLSKFVLCLCLLLTTATQATPKEIIIIRHADKLNQEESGPALSATGLIRSIKFSFYFLQKFGEPDFIIAADDQKENGRELAIRSIQTVAPLANIMQERYPEMDFPIIHPYSSDRYDLLAHFLLNDTQFDDARVLICWSHQRIAKLAFALGVQQTLPTWPKNDYDTVYVIRYAVSSHNPKFTELKNQFPINTNYTWEKLLS